MFSPEALVMVALSALAVYIAYTKLSCPADPSAPSIAWLPTSQEDGLDEADEAGLLKTLR
jgi:hypothetical protein